MKVLQIFLLKDTTFWFHKTHFLSLALSELTTGVLQCKRWPHFSLSSVIASYLFFSHIVKTLTTTLRDNKLINDAGGEIRKKKKKEWEELQVILSVVHVS